MRPRNQPGNPALGGIESGLNRVDSIAKKLLRSNTECLIPEDAVVRHNCMNNCHIVGEKFLELIATKKSLKQLKVPKGQIYCWPTSPRSITRLVVDELKASSSQRRRGSIEVDRYPPVPRSKNHGDCKFTFACKNHDNQVLKPIDSVQGFDPENRETLFKLGLRTVAAYTAWYDGHKRWAREGLRRHEHTIILLKQYPFLQPAFEALSEWGERQTSVGTQLESEIKRWQNAYLNSSWSQAVSHVSEVSVRPRVAACGIRNGSGYPVAVAILPNSRGTSFIIATTLLDDAASPLLPNQQSNVTQEVVNEWEQRFENQPPEQWLPDLSHLCEFLYVSPDDYHNESVISESARHAIETEIAGKISSVPDLRTADPRQILLQRDPP